MLREETGRIIRAAKRIVGEEQGPWTWKPREDPKNPGAGRSHRYVAKPMVVLCLFKTYTDKSFRRIDGFLK